MSDFETGLDRARREGVPLAGAPAEIRMVVPEDVQLAVEASEHAVTPAQVRVLKNTICAKLSIEQLQLYLTICGRKGVDPFTMAYAFPAKDGGLSFGLRIDGMRALSMATGQYISRKVETLLVPDGEHKGELYGARCTVERKGMNAPIVEEAYLVEYDQKQFLWTTHKETMIRKVAESKALRAAFPDALAGFYEPAEMRE